LAEYAMKTILNQWLDPNAKTFSKMQVLSLLCLIGSTDKWKIDVISDEAKPQHKPLHQVASHLQEQEKKFLLALGDNNGASLKYLRALFTPLGIAIEIDPAESSALDRLARSRGFAAHRRTSPTAGRYMYKAVGPEDALKDVEACVAYCGKLLNELPAPPSIP